MQVSQEICEINVEVENRKEEKGKNHHVQQYKSFFHFFVQMTQIDVNTSVYINDYNGDDDDHDNDDDGYKNTGWQ